MQVPLCITSNKGQLRVAFNKKFEKIEVAVPVFDTKIATDVFNVVGLGPTSLGIRKVNNMSDYNMFKGKCPVSFFNQLFTTSANPCQDYPNTNELDIIYYDIEVLTKGDGKFPSAENDPIICIGYALNDNETEIFADYNRKEYPFPDGKIINDFLNVIEQIDPDIYVGYNSYSFDMPYLIERAKLNNLPWWKLYRMWHIHKDDKYASQSISFIKSVAEEYLEKKPADYLGRIHYDIFIVDVKRDQLLTDLKDRKMKTLAKHCGFPDIIELGDDVKDTQKLMMEDKERLIQYQHSDVRQTRAISKRYLPLNIILAEQLNVPLETMISRSNGTPATLFLLKEMYSQNYFVIDSNADRYEQLYLLNPKFQGALNGLMKSGYFNQIHKYDFKNMYPSSMWTWNLGPDTTRIEKLSVFTGEYRFGRIHNEIENVLLLEVPDTNYDRQVHIVVDMSRPSFTKQAIEKLWDERNKYKKLQKTATNEEEKADAKTRDNAIKVILNSLYGLNGNTHSIGDLATAIAVTALCRWTTSYVVESMGSGVVELDTDGIVTDMQYNTNIINKSIEDRIKKEMDVYPSRMVIEDEWGDKQVKAFMYKMKNYVLEVDGNIVKHGVSMKSSSKPRCYDSGINTVIDYVFKRSNKTYQEVLDEILNLESRPLSDFILTTKLNKNINEYQTDLHEGRSMISQLIKQIKKVKHVTVAKDDTLEYIHSIDPKSGQEVPLIPELASKKHINWAKYKKLMNDILIVFDLIVQPISSTFQLFEKENNDTSNDGSFFLNQPLL